MHDLFYLFITSEVDVDDLFLFCPSDKSESTINYSYSNRSQLNAWFIDTYKYDLSFALIMVGSHHITCTKIKNNYILYKDKVLFNIIGFHFFLFMVRRA